MNFKLGMPSPAMVVALIALMVAMTGSATAVSLIRSNNIAKNAVKAKHIAKNAVRAKHIKKAQITEAHLNSKLKAKFNTVGAQGGAGPQGPKGDTGAKGDKGDTGDAGRSALSALQSGETVYGTIGSRNYAGSAGQVFAANSSLPIPAPVGLNDAHVSVDGGFDDGPHCTGTSAAPTAAPGHVCVYPYHRAGLGTASTSDAGLIWGSGDGTKWGFQILFSASGAPDATLYANWAYTAP